jgi:hypothetical protein
MRVEQSQACLVLPEFNDSLDILSSLFKPVLKNAAGKRRVATESAID